MTENHNHFQLLLYTRIQDLVSIYERNIERAFFGRGDWCLADVLSPLKNDSQSSSHKNFVKKILEASLCLSQLTAEAALHAPSTSAAAIAEAALNTPSASAVTADADRGVDPLSSSGSGKLSVSYSVVLEAVFSMHEDTLKGIWEKAESLVHGDSLVVPVPGGSTSYHRMVASSTGECPHFVTTPAKFTGQFKCDTKCPMYATYKIYSHTVASAEVTEKQMEFLKWLIKQKSAPNLTNLSMAGIPKSAGQKGGVPKYTRKRSLYQLQKSQLLID